MASHFRFNTEQISDLAACWKRPKERRIAALYLRDVEGLVGQWRGNNARNQPTSIKEQIALAMDLRINVVNSPNLLEELPRDFEVLLATVWLHHKYGESYFQQHSEACRKDAAKNTARRLMLRAAIKELSPTGVKAAPTVKTELSKLPPSYFQQIKTDADFLKIVANAAAEIEWFLRESKAWLDKPGDEKGLVFMLAYLYEQHFGKLPSVANKGRDGYLPPFRGFLISLSKIVTEHASNFREYKFGAPMARDVLGAIKKSRASVDLP